MFRHCGYEQLDDVAIGEFTGKTFRFNQDVLARVQPRSILVVIATSSVLRQAQDATPRNDNFALFVRADVVTFDRFLIPS